MRTYLFGGLAEDVSHAATAPQAVAEYGDDAHEQRVAGALLVLDHHRRWLVHYGWTPPRT